MFYTLNNSYKHNGRYQPNPMDKPCTQLFKFLTWQGAKLNDLSFTYDQFRSYNTNMSFPQHSLLLTNKITAYPQEMTNIEISALAVKATSNRLSCTKGCPLQKGPCVHVASYYFMNNCLPKFYSNMFTSIKLRSSDINAHGLPDLAQIYAKYCVDQDERDSENFVESGTESAYAGSEYSGGIENENIYAPEPTYSLQTISRPDVYDLTPNPETNIYEIHSMEPTIAEPHISQAISYVPVREGLSLESVKSLGQENPYIPSSDLTNLEQSSSISKNFSDSLKMPKTPLQKKIPALQQCQTPKRTPMASPAIMRTKRTIRKKMQSDEVSILRAEVIDIVQTANAYQLEDMKEASKKRGGSNKKRKLF